MSKICSKCDFKKSINYFNKSSKSKDGLQHYCKLCNKLYSSSLDQKSKKKQYYINNKVKILNSIDKEERKLYNKDYKQRDEVKKKRNQQLKLTRLTNSTERLTHSISSGIRKSLKSNKVNQKWEHLVGYDIEKLKKHLFATFQEGMTFKNYGLYGWHIDHIIPLKYKNSDGSYYWNQKELANYNSETFKKVWALENLKAEWSILNIKKGNRRVG